MFFISDLIFKDKEKFLNTLLDSKKEGVIAKHLNGKYIATQSRGRDRYVKIKRKVSDSLNETDGDGVDAFITGFDLGKVGSGWESLVGSLTLSVNVQRKDGSEYVHEIARVSNIPMELREKMTVIVEGVPQLDPAYYGKVLEIDGQDISSRALRITHARILNWRPDRDQFSCVILEEQMKI